APDAGREIGVVGMTIFRLAGGRIAESWTINDQMEMFRQLGYTLEPPKPQKPPPPVKPGGERAMNEDLSGRVALVTGAARGLGRATAERLLESGASVAVNVRDAARAEELARGLGEGALAVSGDVSRSADVREMVARTVDRFGRLDILVNNAALALSTRFEKITEEEWRRAMDVNLTAVFLCIRAVVEPMR